MLLKVDCLPNAVGKQPSIILDSSWKKMDVKLMMMMMSLSGTCPSMGIPCLFWWPDALPA